VTGRKQLAVGAVVIAIVCGVAYGATRYLRHELFPVELGTKAPDFTAFTVDSVPKEKRLADYRGQVVMINVWGQVRRRVKMPASRRSQGVRTEGIEDRRRKH
jgi:hypothetical protein